MTRLADVYREDANYAQSQHEAQRRVSASDEYLRKLRYQMILDRIAARDDIDSARSSVTGY